MNYTRNKLSGSTDYKPILVTGTDSGSAVTVHQALASVSGFDEIYLWCANTSASAATLTLEWAGSTDPDDLIAKALSIPANSPPIPVLSGQTLRNSKACKAFAGTANVLTLLGHVNRGLQGGAVANTYSRVPLSAAGDYELIPIAATMSPGTLLHTAIASTTSADEIWLWVVNTTTTTKTLTLQWGGVTDPNDLACKSLIIPASSPPVLVAPGLCLRNSLELRAYASAAGLNAYGHLNRITQT